MGFFRTVSRHPLSQVLRVGLYFSLCEAGRSRSSPYKLGSPHERTTVGEQKKQPEIADTENRAHFIGKTESWFLGPQMEPGRGKSQVSKVKLRFWHACLPPPQGANSSDTHWTPRGLWFSQFLANAQGILSIDVCFWDRRT